MSRRNKAAPVDDDSSDVEDKEPEFSLGLDRVICVDGLPTVNSAKREKLQSVTKKLFGALGELVEEVFPFDTEADTSKGYMFIEYKTPQQAAEAVERLNGYRFDKNHSLRVTHVSDMDRIMAVPDEFTEPEVQPFREIPDLNWWLHDPRAREMFAVRYGDESEVYWNESSQKPVRAYARKQWTEFGHVFSPHGSYLATFHRPGIGLWGGEKWDRLNRYPHQLVKFVDFSPCETYLITMSDQEVGPNGRPIANGQDQSVIIWHILSGKNAREFKVEGPKQQWPYFKWSFNDKFFGRMVEDAIYVYETPSMLLHDKKALKLPGVKDFAWSPTQSILAVFTPEMGETPAKVAIIEFPSRRELRQKNLFNVADVKMHWQANGEYLCVKVDRHSKSKKTTTTNLELFRVKERDIPIEVLEVKDAITAFAWEPKGHRFIVAHGEPPRVDVSFYTMRPPPAPKAKKGDSIAVAKLQKVTLLRTLEKQPVNHIYWSPAGGMVVLAGLKTLNGKLLFYNVNDFELMAEEEHFTCTDVEWDPSGRFVGTVVSAWRQQMETGYCIWTFAGKLCTKVTVEKFFQLLWRPRPPSLLTEEQEQQVKKSYASLAKKYLEEDLKLKSAQADEAAAGRRKIRLQYLEGEKKRKELLASRRAKYIHLIPDIRDEEELTEQTFEEILDVKEEVIQG